MNSTERAVLRTALTAFVHELVTDPMIGYLFKAVRGARLERLVEMEIAHAESVLFGTEYAGRDLVSTHQPLAIGKAHFGRRRVLLDRALRKRAVPASWIAELLADTDARMQDIVTVRDEPCG